MFWVNRPAPAGRPRVLHNVYRGSNAQVLHALLLEPGRAWHPSELAERVQVSLSTVHQVCTFLEAQLWMDKRGKGPYGVHVLREPGAPLDDRAAAHSLAEYETRRCHRGARAPAELLHAVTTALADAGCRACADARFRAQLVAPYGTDLGRAWVLVPADDADRPEGMAQTSDLLPVEEGETVTFLVTRERSPFLFRRQAQGFWVASDVQLYLDLWAWPQRGRDQARHLHAARLGS
ncbi:MAG TPA: hypothetical protein VFD01_06705 [Candidatus Dormibacteraeota bacterium]|nr:hypothetical protein [Candidatus Dormibacteraeota bacterium]